MTVNWVSGTDFFGGLKKSLIAVRTLEEKDMGDLYTDNEEDDIAYAREVRKKMAGQLIRDGMPTGSEDVNALLSVLGAIDKSAQGRAQFRQRAGKDDENTQASKMLVEMLKVVKVGSGTGVASPSGLSLPENLAVDAVPGELGDGSDEDEIIDKFTE